MPQTIMVVRPFVYTVPARSKRDRLATEVKVTPDRDPITKDWIPTEKEIDDEMANHEWIKRDFADGAIERPEKTLARLAVIEEKRKVEVEQAQTIIRQAEAALARATSAGEVTAAGGEDIDKALHTPVNELRAMRGADLDKPIGQNSTVSLKKKA